MVWQHHDEARLEALLRQAGAAEPHTLIHDSQAMFMWAVTSGHAKLVQMMLEHGVSPDFQGSAHDSPLHLAVRMGNLPLVELLLKHRVNPNSTNDLWETPLMDALRSGQEAIVEKLLAAGANSDFVNVAGQTPLSVAFRQHLLGPFLSHHVNLEIINRGGETVLLEAANAGDLATTRMLIEHGANIQAMSAFQSTLLIAVAHFPDPDLIRELLQRGLDSQIRDVWGKSAFYYACREGNQAVVEVLLEREKNPLALTEQERLDILLATAYSGNLALLKDLHMRGYAWPVNDLYRQDILRQAAGSKNPDGWKVLEFLREQGFQLQGPFTHGTPLDCAVLAGNSATVDYLLKQGADVQATDETGETALFKAAQGKDFSLFQRLLGSGVNLRQQTRNGDTLLMAAARSRSPDTLRYLLARGLDVNESNLAGHTALSQAFDSINAQLLLEHGADPDIDPPNTFASLLQAIRQGDVANLKLCWRVVPI